MSDDINPHGLGPSLLASMRAPNPERAIARGRLQTACAIAAVIVCFALVFAVLIVLRPVPAHSRGSDFDQSLVSDQWIPRPFAFGVERRHARSRSRRSTSARHRWRRHGFVRHRPVRLGTGGMPARLVAKIREIEHSCGSRMISGFRPGARVAGSGRISLHALHRAADMQGNPRCIYAHLRSWPGGYSIDYGAVHHVHISYDPGGREWGVHFAHYGHRRHYAHRHRVRYAWRW